MLFDKIQVIFSFVAPAYIADSWVEGDTVQFIMTDKPIDCVIDILKKYGWQYIGNKHFVLTKE